MRTTLSDFLIFLHGPSGAGKSEIQRKLQDQYGAEGYNVHYVSSGDLFREAYSNPEIAERSRRGEYLDTLGAILPGLQKVYENFLADWKQSEGKAVLVLDGLIRRGEFTNAEGVHIPSQIDQIAEAFSEVEAHQGTAGRSPSAISQEIKNSKHILIEIDPRDAEGQIKRRAAKEIASLHTQILEGLQEGRLTNEVATALTAWLTEISNVVTAELTDESAYETLSEEAKLIRQDMATFVGKEPNTSLTESFRALGFTTQLRDDDISPIGRRTRIASYIQSETGPEGRVLSPGFIMETLIRDLSYRFSTDGTITAEGDNCLIVRNGASKGIDLEAFQTQCERASRVLYEETAEVRQELFTGPEGTRRRKEQ